MTDDFEHRKSDDPLSLRVMTMREPPGRLGSIVRRLKKMQPVPPPLVESAASGSGDGTE
jgi:hypothetical protein